MNVQLFLLLVWYRILPVRFRKKLSWLPAHLDEICLSLLPIAIGLNPPSIFMRAISFAPKKEGPRGLCVLPSPMRFISLASDFRKLSPALPFDLLTRSLKKKDPRFFLSWVTMSANADDSPRTSISIRLAFGKKSSNIILLIEIC